MISFIMEYGGYRDPSYNYPVADTNNIKPVINTERFPIHTDNRSTFNVKLGNIHPDQLKLKNNDQIVSNAGKTVRKSGKLLAKTMKPKENPTVANKIVKTSAIDDVATGAKKLGSGIAKGVGEGVSIAGKGLKIAGEAIKEHPLLASTVGLGGGIAATLFRRNKPFRG